MLENFKESSLFAMKLFTDDEKILEIKKEAIDNKVPIITNEVLAYMIYMLKLINAKKTLEIGTAVGYSTYYLSKYSEVTSIEIDGERYKKALENFEKLGINPKVINADALEVLENIDEKFDFIFIDAAKGQYKNFFDLCYNKLNENGIIFIDNILFRSYVGSENFPKKYKTLVKKLEQFIFYLNSEYDFVLLPFGDGVGMVKKGN